MDDLQKPPLGHKCNGRGVCCKAIPCPIATEFLGVDGGECPALEFDEGRYWCGLIRGADKYIPGLEGKPWAASIFRDLLLSTGAWIGICDSD